MGCGWNLPWINGCPILLSKFLRGSASVTHHRIPGTHPNGHMTVSWQVKARSVTRAHQVHPMDGRSERWWVLYTSAVSGQASVSSPLRFKIKGSVDHLPQQWYWCVTAGSDRCNWNTVFSALMTEGIQWVSLIRTLIPITYFYSWSLAEGAATIKRLQGWKRSYQQLQEDSYSLPLVIGLFTINNFLFCLIPVFTVWNVQLGHLWNQNGKLFSWHLCEIGSLIRPHGLIEVLTCDSG